MLSSVFSRALVLGFLIHLIQLMAIANAEARVFNINKESFAAYVRGTWGSSFENTMNSKSSGTGVTLNSEHAYNLSGEFGFVYASPGANIRFGLEVLRPKDVKDASGADASGTSLYSLTSEFSVLIPKVAIELNLKKWATSRFYLSGGAGYGNLAGRNSYTFTAAGTSANPGMTDFYEDLRANAVMYEGGLGFESLLTDTTTYVLEGGYRSLNFEEIKHNRDVRTFQGDVTKGTVATNMDGTNRALNLTNYYVGFALRFWLH